MAARASDSLDGGCAAAAALGLAGEALAGGPEWRLQAAALLLLGQVAVGAAQALTRPQLASLASLLSQGLRAAHPRVRWAACHAVGVLGGELGGRLATQPPVPLDAAGRPLAGGPEFGAGAALLGGLVELLAAGEGPACPVRLKAQACRALVGLLDGLDPDEPPAGPPEDDPDAALPSEAAVAARRARARRLLAPALAPLAAPLLAAVDGCAAGAGGRVAGGAVDVPTPLQEFSLDVLCRLAFVMGVRPGRGPWEMAGPPPRTPASLLVRRSLPP